MDVTGIQCQPLQGYLFISTGKLILYVELTGIFARSLLLPDQEGAATTAAHPVRVTAPYVMLLVYLDVWQASIPALSK